MKTSLSQNTPLHIVALTGYIDLIRLLLKHGANRNKKDTKGFKPYEVAIRHGNLNAASLLRPSSDQNINFGDIGEKLLL